MATLFQKVLQSNAFMYSNVALVTSWAMVGAYKGFEEADRYPWQRKSEVVLYYSTTYALGVPLLIYSSPVWIPPYAIYKFNTPTVNTRPLPSNNKQVSHKVNLSDVPLPRQVN
jgi:hypothetical protein